MKFDKNMLEPKKVFEFFEMISSVPHGSGNTAKISALICDFAKERGLEYYTDKLGNVIIYKDAAPGYESADAVILQGHIDMVCEKPDESPMDMENECIDLYYDDGFVHADETTLGADDGIAVAMMLAVLDGDYPAPKLEAVFTVDEEIGMIGASGLDMTKLSGKTLLNIDSEEEGVLTVSCAGGIVAKCVIPVAREHFEGIGCRIKVKELVGGHSGADINRERANADVLLGRVLYRMSQATEMRISKAYGGTKDNAIPAVSAARVTVKDFDAAKKVVDEMQAEFSNEYAITDKNITLAFIEYESEMPFDAESTKKLICFLQCAPNGIFAMSKSIEGLVQTSDNLGMLETYDDAFEAVFCLRSSIDSQKYMLCDKISNLCWALGGRVDFSGEYTGWKYREESRLRDIMAEEYFNITGKKPQIEAIHAGLECGVFSGAIKDLDCISFGPDIIDIHTTREKLSVASCERTFELVKRTLARLK